MPHASAFDLFTPHNPQWLMQRIARGDVISQADFKAVANHHPECLDDPVMGELLRNGVKRGFNRKRGRPCSSLHSFQLIAAEIACEFIADDIKEQRRSGAMLRSAGDPTPRVSAADRVARRYHMSGPSLLNAISANRRQAI